MAAAQRATRRKIGGPTPAAPAAPLLGVYRPTPLREGRGEAGHILPADRRERGTWHVPAGAAGGAEAGDIVLAEPLHQRTHGQGSRPRPVRITARLGRFDGADSLSLMAIQALGLPDDFSAAALAEAAAAGPPGLAGREDLRRLPLVTIDGADARDFDDAVFAQSTGDGFRIIVAIADVAHYVRPGSALDAAARERGNSVYFPRRVLPMLPPALSEHWCSLVPGVERAVVFAEIVIDARGKTLRHRFGRGLMRSAARLTYAAVQRAVDERSEPPDLPPGTLGTLYAAWQALGIARQARGPLDLELPERTVLLDPQGRVSAVVTEPRLASHRLIEDFMILANVAAAEALLAQHLPGLFRVHAEPAAEKLASLGSALKDLGTRLPTGDRIIPRDLSAALAPLTGAAATIAAERMLQSLPQAVYAPANGGHFGLALPAYAHFTSPIRRYADLLVHRALLGGLGLGDGGVGHDAALGLDALASHLGLTERRAVEAERSVLARAHAALYSAQIGSRHDARISGVTRFALFATVAQSGADGIIPVSTLPKDYWRYDDENRRLEGARTGLRFGLGQAVRVRLVEADPVSGRLLFHLLPPQSADPPDRRAGGRSRPR